MKEQETSLWQEYPFNKETETEYHTSPHFTTQTWMPLKRTHNTHVHSEHLHIHNVYYFR